MLKELNVYRETDIEGCPAQEHLSPEASTGSKMIKDGVKVQARSSQRT